MKLQPSSDDAQLDLFWWREKVKVVAAVVDLPKVLLVALLKDVKDRHELVRFVAERLVHLRDEVELVRSACAHIWK